jgi:hypothetical protein
VEDPTGRLDILAWRIAERVLEGLEPELGIPLRDWLMPSIREWAEQTFGTRPLWRRQICSN